MLKLLYIEDDPDVREVAAMALGLDPEVDLRTAGSAEAGLALLEDRDWRAEAILLDLMIPGLDGFALLGRLRQYADHQETPVIFITARTGEADVRRMIAAGARAVITKPFDPMSLAKTVREILAAP